MTSDEMSDTMQALIQTEYGDPEEVLSVRSVPVPSFDDDEVLVRVHASSINPADWHTVRGEPKIARVSLGLRSPRHDCPGCDVAGVLVSVGSAVRGLAVGDRVAAYLPEKKRGGFAEYVTVPSDNLAKITATTPFVDAATLPLAGGTALQAIRDHLAVGNGDRVMIIGASGGVGHFAVQLAKHYGAHVTGVCSASNVAAVHVIGANEVIDYANTDYTIRPPDPSLEYDAILQLGGTEPASALRRVLKPTGRLLVSSGDGGGTWFGPIGRILGRVLSSKFGRGRVFTMNALPTSEDIEYLAELRSAGDLTVSIERTCSLEDVPGAIRASETAHTRGKVVAELVASA